MKTSKLLLLGMLIVAITVPAMAATPSGANNNNVEMSLGGLPTSQTPGNNVDYYMSITNDQSIPSPPWYSANATNMTVTFYPAQADGNPSVTGTPVGTIASLVVDAPAVVIGPVTYPMPTLDPGVTSAVSKAVLSGTILLGTGSGLSFNIEKLVTINLIDWTIDKTVTDVGGDGPSGSVDAAGDVISYQVVITNTGGADLTGTLVDSLPGIYGMTGPVESGDTDGVLVPGETWTYTYAYTATQSDIDNNGIDKFGVADDDGDIDNEATWTDNFDTSQSDTEDVPIVQNINWTIDKTVTDVDGEGASGSVNEAGDVISYQVVITNTGNVILTGSLVDSLPGIYGMTGPVESGDTDGVLVPGETWTYTYAYTATQSDIDNNGIDKFGVADDDGDIDNEATWTDNFDTSQSDAEEVPILIVLTSQICGFKFLDGTDTVLESWEIVLEKWEVGDPGTWVSVASTTTGPDGMYCFIDLEAGDYRVSETLLPDWEQILPYDETQVGNEWVHLVTLPDGSSDFIDGPFYDFVNSPPCYDETAFGKHATLSTCFLDLGLKLKNWGWTNGPLDVGVEYTLQLWAGAGQCDTSDATDAGTVAITYDGTGVVIDYSGVDPDFEIIEEHVYVGSTPVPYVGKKPKPTDAPGQYTVTPDLTSFYLIYHAVVQWCELPEINGAG